MIDRRRRRQLDHAVLIGAICLGAAACGPPASPTTQPITSPTSSTTPVAIRIGPGTQHSYAVEVQPAAGSCSYRADGGAWLPDPSCTPGAVNPQVIQANIATTICRAGWTATVRPPASVTGPEKVGSARAYGYTGSFRTGEYDHLIPLELGGDPNDPANLWLQPNDNPNAMSTRNSKDGLENTLNALVCSGRLTLATAQQAIAANWVIAASSYQS